jgi:signal transduction histidine kinase
MAVEAHGGVIWVEDGPSGTGSCFCLQIPQD